jgi:predicted DNA-binding transcriptional regulator YafY
MRLCVWLGEHSNDGLKPVWGAQVTIAKDLGVNVRTVRRWVELLKAAGLITVEEAELIRDPDTGQIRREHSNTYSMVFPAVEAATAGVEALEERRREQRLGWAENKRRAKQLAAALAALGEDPPPRLPDRTCAPSQPPVNGEVNPPGPPVAKVGAGDNVRTDLRHPEKSYSAEVIDAIAAARAALRKTPRP